jgi:hypothetical protein
MDGHSEVVLPARARLDAFAGCTTDIERREVCAQIHLDNIADTRSPALHHPGAIELEL